MKETIVILGVWYGILGPVFLCVVARICDVLESIMRSVGLMHKELHEMKETLDGIEDEIIEFADDGIEVTVSEE